MKPKNQLTVLKFIYWHGGSVPNERGEIYAHIHLLAGYMDFISSDFQKMIDELRKTFPQVRESDILRKKIESPSCVEGLDISGYSLAACSGFIPKGKYPGWVQYPTARCEYHW